MVRFGVQLWQEEFDFDALKKAWREVEEMGYESAWLVDHFYPMSTRTSNYILEPWTVLPSLAAETSHLRLGVLVTCNSYRFPSVLAKIGASVDVISGGRLEFAIGAGWYEHEHAAYGIPFPDLSERIERLSESVEIIKTIWTNEKACFQGKYYVIKNLVSYPKPVQKPHPPMWIGGRNRKILEIAARHADYVNLTSSVDAYREELDILKRQCLKVGRDFAQIEKTWNGLVILVGKEEDLKREILKVKESSTNRRISEIGIDELLGKVIAGTPQQCVERIQEYVDLGVTYFIPHFAFAQDLQALRIFIEKVATEFK